MSSRVEGENYFQVEAHFYHEQIQTVLTPLLRRFEKILKIHVNLHLLFFLLAVAEVVFLISSFTFLIQSYFFAFGLATIFLTLFAYFILKIYFQTKKFELFKEIKKQYVATCKTLLNYQEGIPEHHIALANACCSFADSLHCKEYSIYWMPKWSSALANWIEKFSCWWHWEDVHRMKELFLHAVVEENIKLVKSEPTSLEVHASLANAYVMLSGHYVDPRKIEGYDEERWIPQNKYSEEIAECFRDTAKKAIEEFKIMRDYAPHDAWVHAQLAYSYHDLQMPAEEIKEYETILEINPDDQEILFKLGVLYFQQGLNANGLRIYEKLKRMHFKKAEQLISYYGNYEMSEVL